MAMNNEPVACDCSRVLHECSEKEGCRMLAQLNTHPAEPKELTVPENSQDWKGMDGATAFWLIERHSNNWTDAHKMMNEWLKANTPQIQELSDEDLDKLVKTAESLKHMEQYIVGLIDGFNHARTLLKKASEK